MTWHLHKHKQHVLKIWSPKLLADSFWIKETLLNSAWLSLIGTRIMYHQVQHCYGQLHFVKKLYSSKIIYSSTTQPCLALVMTLIKSGREYRTLCFEYFKKECLFILLSLQKKQRSLSNNYNLYVIFRVNLFRIDCISASRSGPCMLI